MHTINALKSREYYSIMEEKRNYSNEGMAERPSIGPSGEMLEKRNWDIFRKKLGMLAEKGMQPSIGRAVITACYDEAERRKKIEAQSKPYEEPIFKTAARLFYNAICASPAEDPCDSDFLKPWQAKRITQSLEDVLNSRALRERPKNNAYHAAAYIFDNGYKTVDSKGNEKKYDCIMGLGMLAVDALKDSSSYEDFERNLIKKLSE